MEKEYKNLVLGCQNCKQNFTIEPEDFSFYEKIKVPPPTWCPDCRMVRRLSFRNARSLYKRSCDLCNKNLITMYHSDDSAKVYCNTCWYGDDWDAFGYGMEIDWSRPFLEQWYELFQKVPRFSSWHTQPLVNCEFTNVAIGSKDCYLTYSVTFSENIRYTENVDKSKTCFDSLYITECVECYENIDCIKNYNSHFMIQSKSCIDSWFLFDCVNCQNCFMSANLRNRNYVFYGEQLSKELYQQKMKELDMSSYDNLLKLNNDFTNLCNKSIHRYADMIASTNTKGNHIANSNNIENSFSVINSENLKNSIRVIDHSKDSQDLFGMASGELIYDCVAVSYQVNNSAFSLLCNNGISNVYYSAFCVGSDNLFGCISIKKGSFCILNKKYSREEYSVLVKKLKQHMIDVPYIDKTGKVYKYGEFFPVEFSPFALNESIAFDLYNPKKEISIQQGYKWKESENKDYKITVSSSNLSDNLNDVDDSVLKEIISCFHSQNCEHQCTNAFRILPEDLFFYRQHSLPLPRLCPNCRHYERLAKREPVKLWHRSCMCDKEGHNNHAGKCEVEFETSYAPDRPEKVYCEKCYQQEVY